MDDRPSCFAELANILLIAAFMGGILVLAYVASLMCQCQ